ncbi:MAG: molybdate ABC transporter substrate-binding protein [Pseudomonadota bacterium]
MRGPGSAEPRVGRRAGAVCAGLLAVALTATGLAACRTEAPTERVVTVLAASSLADALPSLMDTLAPEGIDVRLVFAASSTLARQVEAGAPVDIFFSADERWLDRLIDGGHIAADSRSTPLSNRLVLVAPAGAALDSADRTPVQVLDAAVAAMPGGSRLVVGDPAHVPAGRYAQAALEGLGRWERLADRLAFADNVRAALALVERGEAALGVVYATDVTLAPGVAALIELPLPDGRSVRYALGTAARVPAPRRADVAQIHALLTSDAARTHFLALGFTSP